MALIPSMTKETGKRLRDHHIYTVSEIAERDPEDLARILGISPAEARHLIAGAGDALALLRRRSELRRFLRAHLPPRKGRSRAELMKRLLTGADNDVVAHVIAIEHGLALGIEIEAIPKTPPDFAHGHAAHGQWFGLGPA